MTLTASYFLAEDGVPAIIFLCIRNLNLRMVCLQLRWSCTRVHSRGMAVLIVRALISRRGRGESLIAMCSWRRLYGLSASNLEGQTVISKFLASCNDFGLDPGLC